LNFYVTISQRSQPPERQSPASRIHQVDAFLMPRATGLTTARSARR